MVEFYLLTFPRFPLRKKEHKSYFGKNRTHDFRTSRCADYLLDHSDDEGSRNPFMYLQSMIPPKRFDIFPPHWGMLRRSRLHSEFSSFFNIQYVLVQ